MKLRLERDGFTPISTTGTLYVDNEQFCWTLELPKKDGLPGSCIPCGIFKVVAYPSSHFKRIMPLITGIPHRSEIEMHWGESPLAVVRDTKGCVILGNSRPGKDALGLSKEAFDDFWEKAGPSILAGNCTIEVTEPQETHLDAGDL